MKEIREELHPLLQRVELIMNTALSSDVALLDATNKSLREHPGKMLRPVLALLSAGAVSSVNDDTLRFAAAAELLHNATLLHDDVVDGAMERRGRPTVASFLSGGASVLIGDYWLVKSVQVILESSVYGSKAIRIFSKTLSDLAEGELLQMQKASDCSTSREDYYRIIYCKTASLFEAAAVTGALSAGASPKEIGALGEYARLCGLAFQIKDDIFDYSSSSGAIGKPVGIDLKEQKITLPLLCALDRVSEEEASAIRRDIANISQNEALERKVRDFVLENDGPALAAKEMDGIIKKAISSLEILPGTKEKLYLSEFAGFISDRSV